MAAPQGKKPVNTNPQAAQDEELLGDLADRLMTARCRLLTVEPFYGVMASMFRWIRTNDRKTVKTMGVAIVDAEVICIYNEDWCATLTVPQLVAVIKHEVEHIVKLHCIRMGSRQHKTWNIACDMIINGKETSPRIDTLKEIAERFKAKGRNIIWMPDDIKDDITSEEIYEHVVKNADRYPVCPKCGGRHPQSQGKKKQKGNQPGNQQGNQGGDQPGQEQSEGGQGNQPGQNKQSESDNPNDPWGGDDGETECTLDDHGLWGKSNTSEDEAKQLVNDMVKGAIQAGNCPAHLMEDIKRLEKPKVYWKGELNEFIGRNVGNRRRTYARLPRKKDNSFGLKGWSSHARIPLTIMVDTSGSVDSDRLRTFFTEIEHMSTMFKITVVEFTCVANGHYIYRRGDWRKIKVKDRGGTSFEAALQYIEQHRIVGRVNIMLTDGECTIPAARAYPMLWAICAHRPYEEISKNFKWGRAIEIPAYAT